MFNKILVKQHQQQKKKGKSIKNLNPKNILIQFHNYLYIILYRLSISFCLIYFVDMNIQLTKKKEKPAIY